MAAPQLALTNNPYTAPQFFYPSNLGSESMEPYTIFDIRDGVAKGAKSKGTVALPLPEELKTSYTANYEEQNMGILGYNPTIPSSAAAKNIISGAANEIMRDPSGTIDKIWGSVKGGATDTAYATAVNSSARIQRDFRRIVNPHMAVLFQGVGLRTFQLNYTFVADSHAESDMIRNIIFTFKYHMHPELEGSERFLLYPENFVIGLYTPEDKYLFKTSPCVLEGMTVNYNGSSVPAFYADTGAPVVITMSLSFKECEALTKTRIKDGC